MKKKNNAKMLLPPSEMPPDELDRIVGGMGDTITLFKAECGCGWISETVTDLRKLSSCPACKRKNYVEFVRYVFLHGEWIRI